MKLRRIVPVPNRITATLVLAFVACLPATQAGASFIPTSASRGVALHSDDFQYSEGSSTTGFDPFDVSITNLSQTVSYSSTIGPDLIVATSEAVMGSSSFTQADYLFSWFTLHFDVEVPTPFELTGELISSSHLLSWVYLSLRRSPLLTADDLLYAEEVHGTMGTLPLAASGVLLPGSYTLLVHLETNPGWPGAVASFDFALARVPEPGTLLLLGGGVLAIATLARRSG